MNTSFSSNPLRSMQIMSKSSAVTKDGARTAVKRCLRRLFTTAVALTLLSASSALVSAATQNPPDLMTYQGYLTDSTGTPLGNTTPLNFTVVFRLFSVSTGGSALWSESQTVTIDKGNFSVILGQGAQYSQEPHGALTSAFAGADASDRYIEMTVTINGTASTISPRLHMVTSPYAALSRYAVGIYNNDGTGIVNLSGSSISTGTVGDARLSSNVPLKNAGNTFSANQTLSGGLTVNGGSISSSVDLNMTGNTVNARALTGFGTVPQGAIVMWSGAYNTIPSGWAVCDGGYHGGSGRWTPDLRGRFILSADYYGVSSGGYSVGVQSTGGASQVTLSVNQMPSHNHGYYDIYFSENNGINYGYPGSNKSDGDNNPFGYQIYRGTDYAGGNQPFSIMPPFYALYYIMRVD